MNTRVLVVDDEPLRFAESSGGDERRGGTVALASSAHARAGGNGEVPDEWLS
jgi:hypothetical protein